MTSSYKTNTSAIVLKNGSFKTTLAAGSQAGDLTLTLPTTTGPNNTILAANGSGVLNWVSPPNTGLNGSYQIYVDRKSAGTTGGASTANTWTTRTLNTVQSGNLDGTLTSLSSNQVTIQPGIYRIRATAPAYNAERHTARIWNVTDSVALEYSDNCYARLGGSSTIATIDVFLNISTAKTYQIEHNMQSADSAGFGLYESGVGMTLPYEQYSKFEIHQMNGTSIFNYLSCNSASYSTGTVAQSTTTVTGTGTTFTTAMVGGIIIYSSGVKAFITAFGSTTSLTVATSQTVSGGSTYVIYYGGFQCDNSGNTSTNKLQLQSGAFSTTWQSGTQAANVTLTMPTTAGTNNTILATDGTGVLNWVSPPNVGLNGSFQIYVDSKTFQTDAGASSTNTWVVRTLNTAYSGNLDGVLTSRSSNQITIQPGNYILRAQAPAFRTGSNQIRIWNVTDSVALTYGTTEYAQVDNSVNSHSNAISFISITSAKTYQIEHRFQNATSVYGLGICTQGGFSPGTPPEIYASFSVEQMNGGSIFNYIACSPSSYSTGTVAQSTTTVTGTGTTFTSSMVGGVIVYSSGVKAFITAFGSTTTLTVATSQTVSALSTYVIYYGGIQSDNTGNTSIGNASSTTAVIGTLGITGDTNVSNAFKSKKIGGYNSIPTLVFGAGAGTGPTGGIHATQTRSDTSFKVDMTFGTSCPNGGLIFTVTFGTAYTVIPTVIWSANNDNATQSCRFYVANESTTTFEFRCVTTPVNSLNCIFSFMIMGT